MNAIRVAAGLPKYTFDEESYKVSQYISTLISYRKTQLGLDITHMPSKPEGVSDEFYQIALGSGNGYAENLGWSQTESSAKMMMHHINLFLDDSSETPQNFSHRTKILNTEFSKFGYGISNYTFANEFSGYQESDVILQAWPAEGITFMESLVSKKFKWTSQFVKKYKVQDITTVSVKWLNTNEEWSWTDEENTTSRFFTRYTKSISMLNNKVVFYDSSISPEPGYVYEITIHDLENKYTGEVIDYTYRAVFKSLGDTQSDRVYTEYLNLDKTKITTFIGAKEQITPSFSEGATEIATKWTSSNENVATVSQYGTITVKSEGSTTITVTTLNGKTATCNVTVLPYKKGDMNLDGYVNSTDAAIVLDKFKNGNANEEDYLRGDMNEDNMLNSTDAAMILDIFKNVN